MNCVLNAYQDHLKFLGLSVGSERHIYHALRYLTGSSKSYTPGSIAPLIIQMMARARGLEMIVQSRMHTGAFYQAMADSGVERVIARLTDWGNEVDKVDLTPGILLIHNHRHAHFAEYRYPREWVVEVAIQLRRTQ